MYGNKKKFSAYEKLVEGVEQIITEGGYKEFLQTMKHFHNYSFYNQLLIYSQNSDATHVAGYVTWQKLERKLKKHPKTIFVVRPIFTKKKETAIEGQCDMANEEDKSKEAKGKKLEDINGVKFGRIAVYDISDTYGKPIPLTNYRMEGDTTKELFRVLQHISPVDVRVSNDLLGDTLGYYNKGKDKFIAISSRLSQDQKTSVLLHELCHALYDDFEYAKERNLSEIFVESVAFIVADFFELDTSNCSLTYITRWAKGDIKLILELGDKIQKASEKFIYLITEHLENKNEMIA